MKHSVICDSGALISLTSSCLDGLLYFFAEKHNVQFIIPPSVEYECITRPIESNLRKYLFSAIRLKDAIDDGIIVRVNDQGTENDARELIKLSNSLFYVRGNPLQLIQSGEAQMLALSKEIGVDYVLIDERTARLLIESPMHLKEHLEQEFHVNVMVNKANLRSITAAISPLKALRSSEIVMLAYEKGYFANFNSLEKDALEAALYKIKHAGCSISFDEIANYIKSVTH
ncbi:hypothetical protein HZC07_04815 [Candidatus Micrarchaeota archaeon]|nr:hypothetical protein [Candidatus Micrarchaeota archaeon]